MRSRTLYDRFVRFLPARIWLIWMLTLLSFALASSAPQKPKDKSKAPSAGWTPPPPKPSPKKSDAKAPAKRTPPPSKATPAPVEPQLVLKPNTPPPPREWVRQEMKARPTDPWLRNDAHVILALPGSVATEHAYWEPGGSFSPSVSSFGVSLWMTDALGNIKATSDDFPKGSALAHQLVWPEGSPIPGLRADNWIYDATWTSAGLGKWMLDLKTKVAAPAKVHLVIRGVGPAGGEIKSLEWDGTTLLVNKRWWVRFDQPLRPGTVRLGNEQEKNWSNAFSPATKLDTPQGWGYARIDLSAANAWKITLSDVAAPAILPLPPVTAKSTVDIRDLPDSEFRDSLQAQVAHLLMGLDGRSVWPGDPLSHQQKSARAGASVIVALTRAGQLEVAKLLLLDYAERGAFDDTESGAPGWLLWAAEEVAARVNRAECDQELWQHVAHKAEVTTKLPPTASPARKAIGYRGLLAAASFADRFKKPEDAKRWRTQAEQFKQAWKSSAPTQFDLHNPTYSTSLWPSWVAADSKDSFAQGLQNRWLLLRDPQGGFRQAPLQTAFELADAHQWLWLDKPDKAWETVRWFWRKQAVPGLYTWGDVPPEELKTSKWEQVRGWAHPTQITPLYNTAAELVLLQLDMLGYYNEATQELVLGAGAPLGWIDKPLGVAGISTSIGEISWRWDAQKKQMVVFVPDKRLKDQLKNKVRLGVNFPLKNKKPDVDIRVAETRTAAAGTNGK